MYETISNDELSSTMNWVGCLLKDSEFFFILFAENNQILLKISVIPNLLTFIYLVALNLLVNNQLKSSLRHINVTQYVNKKSTLTCFHCDNYVPQWWVEIDDELSWLFLKDSELFILFAENSQILLKISVIPIFLTFMY